MKCIGITTMFHSSENYGGVLQAYALIEVLSQMGYQPEQILIDSEVKQNKKELIVYTSPKKIIKTTISVMRTIFLKKNLQKRSVAFEQFRNCVPHSEKIYTSANINETLNKYDVFVTGSDQVWNMDWYNSKYFLDFVPKDRIKISYAASMPDINISNTEREIVKNHLESFDAISVRESNTSTFLEELTGKQIKCVLDPTLLLSKDDWNKICTERIVKDKYIFCYFLGDDITERKIAKEFSRKLKLKIVTLPHLSFIKKSDIFFGNRKLYDVSPQMFISLIKNAEYVITDSFHAAVFSNIFRTKYYVFERGGTVEMSSRISTLLNITKSNERYLENSKATADYMISIKDLEVGIPSDEFERTRNKSIEFLRKNIDIKG